MSKDFNHLKIKKLNYLEIATKSNETTKKFTTPHNDSEF